MMSLSTIMKASQSFRKLAQLLCFRVLSWKSSQMTKEKTRTKKKWTKKLSSFYKNSNSRWWCNNNSSNRSNQRRRSSRLCKVNSFTSKKKLNRWIRVSNPPIRRSRTSSMWSTMMKIQMVSISTWLKSSSNFNSNNSSKPKTINRWMVITMMKTNTVTRTRRQC
jgi:hypothetical protein